MRCGAQFLHSYDIPTFYAVQQQNNNKKKTTEMEALGARNFILDNISINNSAHK